MIPSIIYGLFLYILVRVVSMSHNILIRPYTEQIIKNQPKVVNTGVNQVKKNYLLIILSKVKSCRFIIIIPKEVLQKLISKQNKGPPKKTFYFPTWHRFGDAFFYKIWRKSK